MSAENSLLLTAQERGRFADWLEMEARSDDEIVAQMEKVGGPAVAMVTKKMRTESMAAKIIAAKLRNTESMTISG